MTVRVGVNLLWMVPGVVGGSEDATVALLDGLVGLDDPDVEVVLFTLPSFVTVHPRLAERFEVVTAPVDGLSKPRRVLAENRWLPAAARRAGVDLMHHGGGVLPMLDRGAATVTIHDLQPLDLPANFSRVKQRYLAATLGPSARRARFTAVPSEFTRRRVIDRLGATPSRVRNVPWSVPERPPSAEAASDPIGRPFVLYPAITYPHKNHLVLLEAFARIPDPDLQLVLIGGAGGAEADVAARADRADLLGRVRRLGRVSRDQRDALVDHALMVTVPSGYEGFGLPALEAMAAGVPVIVSDIPALVEVVDPSAPKVAVDDVQGWAEAVAALATDDARRAELSAVGRAAAAKFTPARTASAMLDVWRQALGTPP